MNNYKPDPQSKIWIVEFECISKQYDDKLIKADGYMKINH